MQNISPSTINFFLENLDDFYGSFVAETIDFLENSFPKNILQESVFEHLILVLNNESQHSFDGTSFYWFQRVQDLLYVGELIYNMNNESSEEMVKDIQEELFIFWNNIGFGIPHNPDLSINLEKASNELLGILEQQIVAFYHLHINSDIEMPHPCLYFPVSELGESERTIGLNFPFYLDINAQALPLIISSKTETAIQLEEGEIPLGSEKINHSTSGEFNQNLENISSLFPVWPKLIKGCFSTIEPIHDHSPLLNCSPQDPGKIILEKFAQHLLELYDVLNEDLSEEELNDQDLLSQKAQEWLLWLYKHEEKNSAFLSLVSL